MKRIIIFASGSGSNAENIITYFQQRESASVVLVMSNNPHAKVLDRCKRKSFQEGGVVHSILNSIEPDLLVLAGFLWKIPIFLLKDFPNRIVNIHPALLPKYGGKGMYGMNVHSAVKANNDNESGITIHYVNENYDEGAIIFQEKCAIAISDTAEDIAAKVHDLEMLHFPEVLESLLKTNE
jgi:phosphoribosylglycinamide formyltransferase-1